MLNEHLKSGHKTDYIFHSTWRNSFFIILTSELTGLHREAQSTADTEKLLYLPPL